MTGKVDVLLGLQWGDEGKGKVVDVLTPKYDVIARFQGFAQHTDFRILGKAFVLVQTDDILDQVRKTGVVAYTTVVSTVK